MYLFPYFPWRSFALNSSRNAIADIFSLHKFQVCGRGKPGIYTRVETFIPWILQNIYWRKHIVQELNTPIWIQRLVGLKLYVNVKESLEKRRKLEIDLSRSGLHHSISYNIDFVHESKSTSRNSNSSSVLLLCHVFSCAMDLGNRESYHRSAGAKQPGKKFWE